MSKTFKDNKLTQGQKLRRTMISKYGSEEDWKAHLSRAASKGGKKSRGGGFADRDLAARAGRKSKRGKSRTAILEDNE